MGYLLWWSLSNPNNPYKHFINLRTNKNIIKKNKILIQLSNWLQLSSLHRVPSTNTFRMPHKCIYMHIYEEFAIQSCILAYKGDANIYGPLWTPTCICVMWIFFLIILYIFPILFFPQKTLSSPISLTITWQTLPIITASCMTSPPYILLFTPYSPVICKDNFPLVYMHKSSRYYAVFHHQFGSYVPLVNNSLSLEIGSTAAFKLLAYIASDFLVLPLSPFIAIHIHIIFAQDLHLLL